MTTSATAGIPANAEEWLAQPVHAAIAEAIRHMNGTPESAP